MDDLAGAGKVVEAVIDAEITKTVYNDALSPAMREAGGISTDFLKTIHLLAAPFQLAAVAQDRLHIFCERIRKNVPEADQCQAPSNIARPVIEAFVSTDDDSPLMRMFEELMAKAINKREKDNLSPDFPGIIKSLSPMEALLIADLQRQEQVVVNLMFSPKRLIVKPVTANFDYARYGGNARHLTFIQRLTDMKLVCTLTRAVQKSDFPESDVPAEHALERGIYRLSMFGHWFAESCIPKSA